MMRVFAGGGLQGRHLGHLPEAGSAAAHPDEAFAAQCVAVARELDFDMEKVNVNGGAIAPGPGEVPALTLKLRPGADVLETALELVEDLKLAAEEPS